MSLRDSAVHGVIWTGIGSVGAGLLNFILTMILARILSPSDYGLLELLAIFTVLSECFIDSGFSQAVIKDQHATQTDLSSVFFFNLAIAIILYAILFACSPLIARFYHEPSLTALSRYAFLVIIFYSCSIIQNANFSRNLQFKPPAIAAIISIIISGLVSVFLAIKGFGVWALATNMVLFAFLKMLFFWILSSWNPTFSVSIDSIKKYFKFGVNLLIQGLIDKFVTNLESLMIGRVYTKTALGYFSQARKLDSYIAQTSTVVIQKVTYPILAKIGDDREQLRNGYRRVLSITMFAMVPLLFFVVASAGNVLFVFFGPQWGQSVPYLRLWSICGLLVSFSSIFVNVFLVTNNTKKLLSLSIIKQILRIITIFALIKISVMALMFGIVLISVFSAIMYSYFGGRLIGYSLKDVLFDLFPTILVALVGSFAIYFLDFAMPGWNVYLRFAIQVVAMLSIYILGSCMLKNRAYYEVKDIVFSLIKSIHK